MNAASVRPAVRRRLVVATTAVLGFGLLGAAPAEAAPKQRATATATATQSATAQHRASASATVAGVTKRATSSAKVKASGKAKAKRAARASTKRKAMRLAQRRASTAAKNLAKKRAKSTAASRAKAAATSKAKAEARRLATAAATTPSPAPTAPPSPAPTVPPATSPPSVTPPTLPPTTEAPVAQEPTPEPPAETTAPDDECGARLAKADGSLWECTLVEQFDGNELDRDLWTPQETSLTGWGRPENCVVDSPETIEVSEGTLKIHTRKHDEPFTCATPGGRQDFESEWSTGSISSWNQFTQAYGRFEFRARMPDVKVQGIHSALWMWPEDDTKYGYWPHSGEIDIAEIFTTYPDRAIPMLHYNAPWGVGKQARTNYFCMIEPSAWTTYVAEWTTEGITISYNGQVCLQHEWNALSPLTGSQPFDQPFMLAISQGLGTTGNEVTDKTPSLATMEVDWVKVWK